MIQTLCARCGKNYTDTVICVECQRSWPGSLDSLSKFIALREIINFDISGLIKGEKSSKG